jgi:hypothetical protein
MPLIATLSSVQKNLVPTTVISIPAGAFLYSDPNNSSSYPGSGTTVFDLSGNGNNGTLINGPTYTSGTPSYFNLDGSNDWIGWGDIGDTYGSFTALEWVYLDTLTGERSMISKWSDTSNQRSWMVVKQDDTGLLQAFFDRSGDFSNQRSINASGAAMTTGVWYLVAITYDSTNGNCQLWRNNVSQGTATFSGAGNLFNSSSPLQTGAQGEPARFFDGRLGQFAIYKSVLSTDDLTQFYNATKTIYGY